MANPPSSSSSPFLQPSHPIYHPHSTSSPSEHPSSPKLKPKPESTAETDLTPPKKTPPLPWTHQETVNLIQAYQEKWYSLKKGQLKASQWEEVSVTVAARCGYDEPYKTATQCRHKMEKLRKRYRAEKVKPYPNSWQYFELMDRMERGGNDRGLRHMRNSMAEKRKNDFDDSDEEEGEDEEEEEEEEEEAEEEEEDEEEEEEDGEEEKENEEGRGVLRKELAAEIRGFAERFMRMENKKIEMMKETERYRMEMENKRMEMIIESQRKIMDTIGRAFGAHKKVKMTQEI
ncbi:hypothetical protein M9H77_01197 [Catharanthus roseus]|uniref:Uncharacterized protein n=1 Tax=Catharanthus roseus TaxID=4058 RepID=A0ACC0C4U8_CATRO|nr:hypothetical protein M9H77_01197 [Catharanthus roseus]